MSKPSIPKGTRDFTPLQTARRNYIFDTIKKVFKRYGFQQIETPAMENLQTLTGKYGNEGDKLLFKIINSGSFLNDLKDKNLLNAETDENTFINHASEKGLRYDLTVPLARFVVMNRNEISFPFKRFQIQPVWRADRPQRGRYREFYQCDADVVGSNSLLFEAELICIYTEVFQLLNLPIRIKLNNRKILEGLVQHFELGIPFGKVAIIIDKLDKIGESGVKDELVKENIDGEKAEQFIKYLSAKPFDNASLEELAKLFMNNEKGQKGVVELIEILKYMPSTKHIDLDLSLARGLDYYTGAIIEVVCTEVKIGSIGGGGRYDNLTEIFGLKDMSGVGISFGADRIYDALEESGLFPENVKEASQVLICNMLNEAFPAAFKMAQALRDNDISCILYPEANKLKKQLDFANTNDVEYVVIIGETEISEDRYTLKNMKTGIQEKYSVPELIQYIKNN